MGQPITVTRKPTTRKGVLRFETNRSLTGMAHERYTEAPPSEADRPPDVLARRLFEEGNVVSVHIFSNVVTVSLAPGADTSSMARLIEELFIHYREGVTPSLP